MKVSGKMLHIDIIPMSKFKQLRAFHTMAKGGESVKFHAFWLVATFLQFGWWNLLNFQPLAIK